MASTRTKSALERTGLDLVAGRFAEASGARVAAMREARRPVLRSPALDTQRARLRELDVAAQQARQTRRTANEAARSAEREYRRARSAAIVKQDAASANIRMASTEMNSRLSQSPGTVRKLRRVMEGKTRVQAARAIEESNLPQYIKDTYRFQTETRSNLANSLREARRLRDAAVSARDTARSMAGLSPAEEAAAAARAQLEAATTAARTSADRAVTEASGSYFNRMSGAIRRGLEPLRRGGEWLNRVTGGTVSNPFARRVAQSAAGSAPGRSWLMRGLSWAAHTPVGQALNPLNPQASAWAKRQLLRNVWGTSALKEVGKRTAVGMAQGTKAFVTVPAKLLSKEYELIGKGVSKIAGKNLAGKMLSSAFSAGGLAGGFALSSNVDALLNAYDFFTSSEFKSGNRDNQMTFKVNGKSIKTSDESGVMNAIMNNKLEFARTYGTEVAKGIFRAATFGLVGSGDDTFLDRLADPGVEPEGKADAALLSGIDPRTGEMLTDENGNHLGPRDLRALQAQMLASDKANKVRTKFARLALGKNYNDEDKKAYVTDAAAVRTTLREMQIERARRLDKLKTFALNPLSDDARLARPFANAVERSEYEQARENKDMSYLANWANKFYSSRVGGIDAEYDRWVSGLAKLAPAKRVMEANRLAAYKALTGSDIGQDEQLAAAQDAGARARLDAFKADWSDAELTDARRLDLDPRTLVNTPVESAGSAGAGGEN